MMKLSSRAHDLYEAFEQPGCPVCRLTLASVHQYLDSLIYEYVNKPATHAMVRAARGFCPRHGWHIENELNASAFAIAILYEGLVRTLLKDMGNPGPNGGRRQVNQAGTPSRRRRPVRPASTRGRSRSICCATCWSTSSRTRSRSGSTVPPGCACRICARCLRSTPTPGPARVLAGQQAIWSRLQADLSEFVRKHDYRYGTDAMGEEGTSAPRDRGHLRYAGHPLIGAAAPPG